MSLRRRNLLLASASAPLATLLAPRLARTAGPPAPEAAQAFDDGSVQTLARELSSRAFEPPKQDLPDALKNLTYDQYRAIRFNPRHALWRDLGLPFQVQFFHRGLYYTNRVDIYEVENGLARPVHYSPDLFQFDKVKPPTGDDLGFAGFRIHASLNRPDWYDEFCVFLGASYFRALAKGQAYGLSARGLAIKTADPGGEEFPFFKSFWLERPARDAQKITLHALLDSQNVAGAYKFTIRPGEDTVMQVEAHLYPRADIAKAGIAPMTSMFLFDTNDRTRADDYRHAVHDSGGLAMTTEAGERIWRPLNNPQNLQYSVFTDDDPRGFGLMQRKRNFAEYEDLEAHYELRPSLWAEPDGAWGKGGTTLIEIPTDREIHDNIVAFWRPLDALRAHQDYVFKYRLHWCWHNPARSPLGRVVATRCGLSWDRKNRLFVLDLEGGRLGEIPKDAKLKAEVTADKGKILDVVAAPNSASGGWRISFEFAPDGSNPAELRAVLRGHDAVVSETWLYRWTP